MNCDYCGQVPEIEITTIDRKAGSKEDSFYDFCCWGCHDAFWKKGE